MKVPEGILSIYFPNMHTVHTNFLAGKLVHIFNAVQVNKPPLYLYLTFSKPLPLSLIKLFILAGNLYAAHGPDAKSNRGYSEPWFLQPLRFEKRVLLGTILFQLFRPLILKEIN